MSDITVTTLTAMRRIRDRSTRLLEQAARLGPPAGTIAVGGGHFDLWLAGEALATFLGALSRGATPEAAYEQAVAWSHEAVATWNSRREWQVHRAAGSAEPLLLSTLQQVLQEGEAR